MSDNELKELKYTRVLGRPAERIVLSCLNGENLRKFDPKRFWDLEADCHQVRQFLTTYQPDRTNRGETQTKQNFHTRFQEKRLHINYSAPFVALADRLLPEQENLDKVGLAWENLLTTFESLFGDDLTSEYWHVSHIARADSPGTVSEIRYPMTTILAVTDFVTNPDYANKLPLEGQKIIPNIHLTKKGTNKKITQIDAIITPEQNEQPSDFWKFLWQKPTYSILEIKTLHWVPFVRTNQTLNHPLVRHLAEIRSKLTSINLEWRSQHPRQKLPRPQEVYLLYLRFPAESRVFKIGSEVIKRQTLRG